MSGERCRELLDSVVNYVSCANNTQGTLHELLLIGFTAKELKDEFSFNADDIQEALDSIDYE